MPRRNVENVAVQKVEDRRRSLGDVTDDNRTGARRLPGVIFNTNTCACCRGKLSAKDLKSGEEYCVECREDEDVDFIDTIVWKNN